MANSSKVYLVKSLALLSYISNVKIDRFQYYKVFFLVFTLSLNQVKLLGLQQFDNDRHCPQCIGK